MNEINCTQWKYKKHATRSRNHEVMVRIHSGESSFLGNLSFPCPLPLWRRLLVDMDYSGKLQRQSCELIFEQIRPAKQVDVIFFLKAMLPKQSWSNLHMPHLDRWKWQRQLVTSKVQIATFSITCRRLPHGTQLYV